MKNEQKITSHSVVHNSKVKDNGARRISRKEGENRINQLILKLIAENRYDDLEHGAKDPEYQEQLLKEFGL